MSTCVIDKVVAAMKKKKVQYPYGDTVKICVCCSALNPGSMKKCHYCGGKIVKVKGWLYLWD